METGYVIIDEEGFPIGFVLILEPWLEMISGLGVTNEVDDDGVYHLYGTGHDLLARVHKIEIGF